VEYNAQWIIARSPIYIRKKVGKLIEVLKKLTSTQKKGE